MRNCKKTLVAIVLTAALIAVATTGCDEEMEGDNESSDQRAEVAAEAVDEPDDPLLEGEEVAEPHADFYEEFAPLPAVPDTLDELPEGVNVVQYEMRLLTEAMQNILRLIADGRLAAIPDQISQVHPAYELTHRALEEGLYAPPVNSHKIDEFIALDDEFHDDLRSLVRAGREGDLQGATDSYSDLVQGCTNCHGQFRFPAP